MKYIVSAGEMRRYDKNTIEKIGIPGMVLMERAALAVFGEIEKYVQKNGLKERSALILAGMGNNGGDGLDLARLLSEASWEVEVWCVGDESRASGQWKLQSGILENYPVKTGSKPAHREYTILVDALFGVGLSRKVTGLYAETIEQFNGLKGYRLAVDMPSGVCADTGKILGTAVRADETVTFGFLKRGHFLYPGCSCCGIVKDFSIGIGEQSFFGEAPEMFCYDEPAACLLPERNPAGNKGTFGKVLLVAGSLNMAGASVLAARASYRAGAGMVKVITPEENRVILQCLVPEALLGRPEELADGLSWADVIAIGPGLSKSREALNALKMVICESSLPLVLDADALNLLSENPALQQTLGEQGRLGRKIILTPHVGELSRLTGRSAASLKEDLPSAGKELAERFHAVAVIKDARSFICDGRAFDKSGGRICMNITGNSGMAAAGSGDVLTGIVAGLLAQGMEPFPAASVGAYLHGKAGNKAAKIFGEHGLMAGEIADRLCGKEEER